VGVGVAQSTVQVPVRPRSGVVLLFVPCAVCGLVCTLCLLPTLCLALRGGAASLFVVVVVSDAQRHASCLLELQVACAPWPVFRVPHVSSLVLLLLVPVPFTALSCAACHGHTAGAFAGELLFFRGLVEAFDGDGSPGGVGVKDTVVVDGPHSPPHASNCSWRAVGLA